MWNWKALGKQGELGSRAEGGVLWSWGELGWEPGPSSQSMATHGEPGAGTEGWVQVHVQAKSGLCLNFC